MAPLILLLDHVPQLVKICCEALLLIWLVFMAWMLLSRAMVMKHLRSLATLGNLLRTTTRQSRTGLDLEGLDKLRSEYEKHSDVTSESWRRLDDHIELYVALDDSESYYLTEPVREILSFDALVGRAHYGSFFGIIPGILTGLGLGVTFVAILQALYDVHYDKTNTVNPITGTDTLINGLSGKFISSILAIFLAILFTFAERWAARTIKKQYDMAVSRVARAIPYLSPSRILLDIHRFSSKQATSLSHLSSELVDGIRNTLNNDVVPGLAEGMSAGVAVSMQAEYSGPVCQDTEQTIFKLGSAPFIVSFCWLPK